MKAIRPVFFGPIGETTRDLNMGELQDEVETLPVTVIERQSRMFGRHFVSFSRWELSDEERAAIAAGANIVHQVIHTIGAYPPMHISVVMPQEHPGIVQS